MVLNDPTSTGTYRYFVSFIHDRGFGRTEVRSNVPMRSESDLNLMTDSITSAVGSRAVILNFALMSGPNTDPGIAAMPTGWVGSSMRPTPSCATRAPNGCVRDGVAALTPS